MITKKFGVGLAINILIKVTAIALGIYTNRWINTNFLPETYKDYNLIISYTAIILGLINFGLPILIQKFYTNNNSQEERNKFWSAIFSLRIISYFVGLFIILITKNLSGVENLWYIISMYTFQFILMVDLSYASVYNAKGEGWKYSITDFIGKITIVSCLLAYSKIAPDTKPLDYLITISFIGYTFSLLIDSLWLYKQTRFKKFSFDIIKKNLKPIGLLALSTAMIAFYQQSNLQFLEHFGYKEEEINGFKNAFLLLTQALVVTEVILPQLASLAKKKLDKNEVSRIGLFFGKFTQKIKGQIVIEWSLFVLFLGLGAYLGMIIFGPIILNIIDKDSLYPLAFDILPIISLFIITNSIAGLLAYITIFFDREKYNLIAVFGQAVLSIILYTLLVPRFGTFGAAWALVALSVFDLVLMRIPLLIRTLKKQIN